MDQGKKFGFTILGSGSSGNATVIHCPGGNLLLDAGFSLKELTNRMKLSDISPDSIRALLITHEHQDHLSGCRLFADTYQIPAYMTVSTARRARIKNLDAKDMVLIQPGSRFELCGVMVEPFSVSHDVDTVAFTFSVDDLKFGYATDVGKANMLFINKLTDCNALVLESNYDLERLKASRRPLNLKHRIMGISGHLSNEASVSLFGDLLTERTRDVVLAHLSRECNCPEIVRTLAEDTLHLLHREDVCLHLASQDKPLETIWI